MAWMVPKALNSKVNLAGPANMILAAEFFVCSSGNLRTSPVPNPREMRSLQLFTTYICSKYRPALHDALMLFAKDRYMRQS